MSADKLQIAMVCHGNICRSPMAEIVTFALIEQSGLSDKVSVESFGTHAYHIGENADKRSIMALKRHGWPIFEHKARQIKPQDLERLDIVLCADRSNLLDVRRLSKNISPPPQEISLLRSYDPDSEEGAFVPDPYYHGQEAFDETLEIIEVSCKHFVQNLVKIFTDI